MKIIVIQQFTSPVLELCIVELKGTGDKAYYSYDGSGQRVRKVVVKSGKKTERLYLGGLERYREYSASGTVKLERWTLQVDDIAQVDTLTVNNSVTVATPIPLVRYQYRDHLGSATLETNEDGVVISYEEYHPYGTSAYRTAKSGTDLSLKRYRFTNKERDDETGLYYFGVRYYAAWLGRWTSSDPGGFVDGLNLYQYAQNNPVRLMDERGFKAEPPPDDLVDRGETDGAEPEYAVDRGEFKDVEGGLVLLGDDKKGEGYYYATDGRFLGQRGSSTNVYVVDTDEESLESYQKQYGYGRLNLESSQLMNSEGEAMTHEQFITRIFYNWGEGQNSPPKYYAHAMINRGESRGGEDEIYSSRSKHKMIDGRESDTKKEVNKNYLKFKKYKDSGFTFDKTWSEEDKRRLKGMYSAHLAASAGLSTDPVKGHDYWLGGWRYIDKARKRNTSTENVLVVLVYRGSDSSNYKKHLLTRKNFSVNIFYHYGKPASGSLGIADVVIYDKDGNQLEKTSINSKTKLSSWRIPPKKAKK
ncbi:RHS repeat-associated core domain-containing protein [Aureispira anguillae]|uniref:RHS repeat-associated core domain-containing protein n=1 Tax=Aureispira anguillae TaxID=2864201 RepID=A0A915YF32_9BACT|nr:RHS repeat-associated core domain-containing protein [Aureispira anguillae]BDS11953.1 RHS repeat-associated core domain-containing protein [Aureispira anguillae]